MSEVCKKYYRTNKRAIGFFFENKANRRTQNRYLTWNVIASYFENQKNISDVLSDARQWKMNLIIGRIYLVFISWRLNRKLIKKTLWKKYLDGTDSRKPPTFAQTHSKPDKESLLMGEYNTVVPHNYGIRTKLAIFPVLKKRLPIKHRDFNYEIPFALDTKIAPVKIVQKYYNELGEKEPIVNSNHKSSQQSSCLRVTVGYI